MVTEWPGKLTEWQRFILCIISQSVFIYNNLTVHGLKVVKHNTYVGPVGTYTTPAYFIRDLRIQNIHIKFHIHIYSNTSNDLYDPSHNSETMLYT